MGNKQSLLKAVLSYKIWHIILPWDFHFSLLLWLILLLNCPSNVSFNLLSNLFEKNKWRKLFNKWALRTYQETGLIHMWQHQWWPPPFCSHAADRQESSPWLYSRRKGMLDGAYREAEVYQNKQVGNGKRKGSAFRCSGKGWTGGKTWSDPASCKPSHLTSSSWVISKWQSVKKGLVIQFLLWTEFSQLQRAD